MLLFQYVLSFQYVLVCVAIRTLRAQSSEVSPSMSRTMDGVIEICDACDGARSRGMYARTDTASSSSSSSGRRTSPCDDDVNESSDLEAFRWYSAMGVGWGVVKTEEASETVREYGAVLFVITPVGRAGPTPAI